LRNHSRQREDTLRARNAGRITAQMLKGALLVLLLSGWVTATVTGAILVALLTVVLEFVLEPVVEGQLER
ncbi:MAG TPA: hypothetical protein VF635_03805, partial [Propionibacteriaceae bacterium]